MFVCFRNRIEKKENRKKNPNPVQHQTNPAHSLPLHGSAQTRGRSPPALSSRGPTPLGTAQHPASHPAQHPAHAPGPNCCARRQHPRSPSARARPARAHARAPLAPAATPGPHVRCSVYLAQCPAESTPRSPRRVSPGPARRGWPSLLKHALALSSTLPPHAAAILTLAHHPALPRPAPLLCAAAATPSHRTPVHH